jgi:hypothetical protein
MVSVGFNVSTAYRDGGPPTKVSAIVCPLAPSPVARVAVPVKSNFEGCAELSTTDQLNLRAPLEAPPYQVRTVVILSVRFPIRKARHRVWNQSSP